MLGALVDRVGWRTCAVIADIVRCLALLVVMSADSLPLMIAGAALTGIGTALFNPAALAGLPLLMSTGNSRAAGMGLFGAIDDLGLTAGPALAAILLAVISPDDPDGPQRRHLRHLRGDDRHDRLARRARRTAAPSATLLGDARAGVRELASRPEIRTLLASSTGVVLCIGITNVGEVVLAREVLHIGGSGLALLVTAGGLGTILGSLCARFTTAGAWAWRRAYVLGIAAMAVELLACAVLHSFWLVVPALMLGGFGNGLALVHDRLLLAHSTPQSLHGRLFALQKTCTSFAFALSFLASGALIAGAGVQTAFLVSGLGLTLVMASALPRLRAAWPTPTPGTPNALGDALA